jgi:hypothetical protein
VHDFLHDDELRNPMGALFAVTMLTLSRKGETHTARDYSHWFKAAGLKAGGVHGSAGMPSTFLFAEK